MNLLANSHSISSRIVVPPLEVTKVGHLAVFVAVSARSCIAVLIDAVPPRVNVMNSATAMLSLFLIYE